MFWNVYGDHLINETDFYYQFLTCKPCLKLSSGRIYLAPTMCKSALKCTRFFLFYIYKEGPYHQGWFRGAGGDLVSSQVLFMKSTNPAFRKMSWCKSQEEKS